MTKETVSPTLESADVAVWSHLEGEALHQLEPGWRESDGQLRELVAHLQQVFWIKDAADRAVLYVSPAYEKIWGRTCQSLYDNFQTFVDAIHPEDRARATSAPAGRHETGGYDEEFRILRPDGAMRWIWARSYPVRDEQGRINRFAGIAEDITERKSCEKERARLATIVEYCEDAVVSMTVDGTIVSWNPGAERQYGYTAGEIVGRSISLLFPPDHFQEYLQIIAKVGKGEAIPAHDRVRLRKDGSLINVSVGVLPIESRHGDVLGASKIGHNLTRFNQLEAQFIAAQKMEVVGQLAGGVAHDFNNILSVILCYSDWMVRDLKSEDPMRKQAEEIRDAAARAAGLTRQLLAFSRKQPVEAVVLDLNEVVTGLDQMLRRLIDENIELSFALEARIGRINADAGYLGQVLMNLVVNARDAMPGGGRLSIATNNVTLDENFTRGHPDVAPGDYVMLSVGDTGSGMTDEVKARLFEAFFTTKPQERGTGLGLATCLTIVKQSNGHIIVSSVLGEGTTFKIYFPRVDEPVEAAAGPVPEGALPRGTETLLLAEDEPAVRHLANHVLESLGYTVLRASNGQDGLRVAREHRGEPIRLVVTDVIMPQMGGKVMAEWLKATYPSIKILFTSGYTDDAIAQYGVLDPGVAFLAKPYTPVALARKVREMLDAPQT